MSQIPFLVETSRILEILSKQIYDSPYAMVRENVQNAYDAIRMRAKRELTPLEGFTIQIDVAPDSVEIRDNGIGMSEGVLRENFWRAGSSGKNNAEARAAGVIGTFGIGAMANFGVCAKLQVDTREAGAAYGIRTSARKSDLSIGADCIELERLDNDVPEGTCLRAEMDSASRVDISSLRSYILPFVRFLPVQVLLNGELVSRQDPRLVAGIGEEWQPIGSKAVKVGRFEFDLGVWASGSQLGVIVDRVVIEGVSVDGGLWLRHGGGQLMGLRSRFALAPIPVSGLYQLGGFVDLPTLVPTAGREALTRESIQEASQLISTVETNVTELIKDTTLTDEVAAFQQHIIQLGQTAWAGRVTVQLSPGDERRELRELATGVEGDRLMWYAGTDPDTIKMFGSAERPLIRLSQQNPRREVQQRYLSQVLRLESVPDTATILQTYSPKELSYDEVSLMLAIARVLKADYLIDDVEIVWARISHGVTMLAGSSGERLTVTLSRTWPAVLAVLKIMEVSPELTEGLTKDLVRVHLYSKIQSFVPSSQRVGLEALQKSLSRRRELYRLELEDTGALEPIFAEFLAGRVEFEQVLNAATRASAGHTQRVGHDSVGTVDNVLVDVVNTPLAQEVLAISAPVAGPPILRPDLDIRERLLTADRDISQLNNYRLFLGLSDRVFQLERDFFTWPHSTQVAWAGRRVVFLFSLAHSAQMMYYDIELRGARTAGDAGGVPIHTTTIIAKNRIFIPVPPPIVACLQVTDTPVEFYVRFDIIGH